jgi:thiamine-phosphate pyrophosphorylase
MFSPIPKSQPQAASRRKLLAAARLAKPSTAQNGRALPRALFVTDPVRTPDILMIARRLPRGFGIVWRHYGADHRLATGRELARICRQRGLILLVSADPELAARIGAHGVHWPEARLSGNRLKLSRLIETASAHDPRAIARAARLGVDAVILSPVFPSRSPSAGKPLGIVKFRQLAHNSAVPVYALGGVGPRNAASAMTHAAGWAAIDSVVDGWGS